MEMDLISNMCSWMSVLIIATALLLLPLIITCLQFFLKRRTKSRYSHLWQKKNSSPMKSMVVGFFHPYCNAGGGGERVLWCGIRSLQKRYDFVHCIVYTGDIDASASQILSRAKERFNIELDRPVEFIYLNKRRWVEAGMWPYFTLLGQSIGSLFLGIEALIKFVPDIYIDTMGYSFTYPLFRFIGGCTVGCYVHYPTISTDMLSKVKKREKTYNNVGAISNSRILTYVKVIYYKIFAFLYGLVGKCSSVIMVNSTWTQNHVNTIWNKPSVTSIVYPPCNTKEFSKLINMSESKDVRKILSIGQFRPEKNHAFQIKSFARFLKTEKKNVRGSFKLALVGSCRNDEDAERVANLMELCEELEIKDSVEFHLNIPYSELKEQLSQSMIGIHTMWNEHFGIGIVEFMAAKVIPLAHDSGGPKLDIVKDWNGKCTGFLADDEVKYATKIKKIVGMTKKQRELIRSAASESVHEKFSDEIFENNFLRETEVLIKSV